MKTGLAVVGKTPRRRIVADATTRTAEEDARVNGFVGAIPGTEGLAVAIPDEDRTFDVARDALLEQGKVEVTQTRETAAGFTRKSKVIAKDGNGGARQVTVTERINGDGKVTSLATAQGRVKLDKEALFEHIKNGLTLGPFFSGDIEGNGSLCRSIVGWELKGQMFREAYATWDVVEKAIDESRPVGFRDWKPAVTASGCDSTAWLKAQAYAKWAEENETPVVDNPRTLPGELPVQCEEQRSESAHAAAKLAWKTRRAKAAKEADGE